MNIRKHVEKIKRELAALEKEAMRKDWPYSFEEAMQESIFWGFSYCGRKYFIIHSGPYKGYACDTLGMVTKHDMGWFWSHNFNGIDYYFKKFYTASDLYLWMAKR